MWRVPKPFGKGAWLKLWTQDASAYKEKGSSLPPSLNTSEIPGKPERVKWFHLDSLSWTASQDLGWLSTSQNPSAISLSPPHRHSIWGILNHKAVCAVLFHSSHGRPSFGVWDYLQGRSCEMRSLWQGPKFLTHFLWHVVSWPEWGHQGWADIVWVTVLDTASVAVQLVVLTNHWPAQLSLINNCCTVPFPH